jgi:hypothetical protein
MRTVQHHLVGAGAPCEKRHSFLSFPYVFPEPVLVKLPFLYINGANSGVFRTNRSDLAAREVSHVLEALLRGWEGVARVEVGLRSGAACVLPLRLRRQPPRPQRVLLGEPARVARRVLPRYEHHRLVVLDREAEPSAHFPMSRVERFVFRVGDLQRADLKALRDGYLVVVALVVVAVQLAAARGVARGVGAVVVGAERPVACEDKSGSWFSQQRVVGASKCLARKRQGVSVPSTEAETVIYRTSPAARASGRPPFRSCRDGLAQCEASSLADRRLQPAGAAAPAAAARARPSSSTEPGAWPARV